MSGDELDRALRDPDAEVRRQAVASLADEPPGDVEALLYEALGDADWRVRKEAVRVVDALQPREAMIPKLIEALCDGDNVGRRNAGLEALGLLGSRAVAPLMAALPQVPEPARKFLVDALGDTGDPRVVALLVEAAEDRSDPNVAAAALDGLARVGGPAAEEALRRQLRGSDPFQRMAALDGLVRLRARVPWEELAPLLSDRLVRRVALGLLGRTGHAGAVAPLVEALADGSPHVVAAAAVALVELSAHGEDLMSQVSGRVRRISATAREALCALLESGDLRTRQATAHLLLLARDTDALEKIVALAAQDLLSPEALRSLQEWGADAVGPLLEVYRRARGWARPAALEIAGDLLAEASARGGAPDASLQGAVREAVRAATADPDPRVVLAAARSMAWWAEAQDAGLLVRLSAQGPEEVARACGDALERLLESQPDAVRRAFEGVVFEGTAGAALARVAARMGGPQTFERLQTALAADDPASRRAGVDALAAIGDRRSAEHIAYALTDESVDVQAAAAHALGKLRDEAGQPLGTDQLLLALRSDSPAVQAAAARALGESGSGAALEPLRELLSSEAPGVAVAALQALRALSDPAVPGLLLGALDHPDGELVKEALKAIDAAGGEARVSGLARGLAHPAWDVRALSARLLGQVGSAEARAALVARHDHETDAAVRQAIDEALGRGEHE
jgi:HEAT repeat protein